MVRSCPLVAVISLLAIVGVAVVLERAVRRAQVAPELAGRESWAPNYRHVWFSHDAALESNGQWSDFAPCMFGMELMQFRDNWQAHCNADWDNDGLTNGQELGDPCCLWTPAAVGQSFSLLQRHEYRRWSITHPSQTNFNISARVRSVRVPESCEDYNAETYRKQLQAFYFHGAFGPQEEVPLNLPKVLSFLVLVVLLSDWFWRRGLASDVCPWLIHRKHQLSRRVSLVACATSFLYMDLTSGIVHLILDYAPHFLPGLGPLAKGFQYHHEDPTAIIRISWYAYVSHVHLLLPLIAALLLLSDASRVQRLFWFWCAVFVHLFQTTHRWAHFPPETLPTPVLWLQRSGLLLSHERHMSHHEDLERQFTILSGHTDVILDAASKVVPPWRYDLWLLIGIGWLLLPILLDVRFRTIIEACDLGAISYRNAVKPKGKDGV